MVKKIIQYNLHWHTLAAGLLFLAKAPLYDMLCQIISFTEQDPLYHVCQAFFYIVLFIAWLFAFTVLTLGKLYEQKTAGRKLLSDTVHYKMNYFDLVDKLKDADPLKIDTDTLPQRTWRESTGIVLGQYKDRLISYEPEENGRNGVVGCIWGAPGTGKTACNIITTARNFQGSVMLADLKGDIYKANKDHRDIMRFSIIDWKNSSKFDPLEAVRKAPLDERDALLENLAITIVPGDGTSEGQFFTKGARDFFTGIALYLLEQDIETPFPVIIEKIVNSNFKDWVNTIISTDSKGKKYVSMFYGQNEKNCAGCFGQLVSSTRLFSSDILKTLLTPEPGNTITYQDLEDGRDIYIQLSPVSLELYSPLITMIFDTFMGSVLHRKEHSSHPLCFILDEFGSFGYMPILYSALSMYRSFNASLVFSCQSLAMLERVYGPAGARIFLDCAKIHVFHSLQDTSSRDWASRLCGFKKTLKISNSIQKDGSTSKTVSEALEPIFQPTDFAILPGQDKVIVNLNGKYIKADKTYYFKP